MEKKEKAYFEKIEMLEKEIEILHKKCTDLWRQINFSMVSLIELPRFGIFKNSLSKET